MEPVVGFEPTTDGLQNRCSTTELNWQTAAARRVPNGLILEQPGFQASQFNARQGDELHRNFAVSKTRRLDLVETSVTLTGRAPDLEPKHLLRGRPEFRTRRDRCWCESRRKFFPVANFAPSRRAALAARRCEG